MLTCMRLGWRPAEFWAATLAEIELAMFVEIDKADQAATSRPMTEDEMRDFYDRLQADPD